jgi:hypothetical protein
MVGSEGGELVEQSADAKVTLGHPLHVAVADAVAQVLLDRGELIRDPACGGEHQLPLFVGSAKGRHTRMCNVDLLVVSRGQVRVIMEIEESGFLPTKICGKFLQSAIASHFVHDSQPAGPVPYGKRVLFVQVIDGSKCLKPGSRKEPQAALIERKIREMLPLGGGGVTDYGLFFVGGAQDSKGLRAVSQAVASSLE